jgi:3-isopropylmalate/(R)-2-methylmalate dehydratase large subunit
MTITEKIFARAAGQASVKPGDLVNAKLDGVMCHDVTTPPSISMLKERGIDTIFDPEKLYITPDHFQPAKDIKSAELHKRLDKWARENNLPYYSGRIDRGWGFAYLYIRSIRLFFSRHRVNRPGSGDCDRRTLV